MRWFLVDGFQNFSFRLFRDIGIIPLPFLIFKLEVEPLQLGFLNLSLLRSEAHFAHSMFDFPDIGSPLDFAALVHESLRHNDVRLCDFHNFSFFYFWLMFE